MSLRTTYRYQRDPEQGYRWDPSDVPSDVLRSITYVEQPSFRAVQNAEHVVAPLHSTGRYIHIRRSRPVLADPTQRGSAAFETSVSQPDIGLHEQLRTLYDGDHPLPREQISSALQQLASAAFRHEDSPRSTASIPSVSLVEIANAFLYCSGEEMGRSITLTSSLPDEAPGEGLHIQLNAESLTVERPLDPDLQDVLGRIDRAVMCVGEVGLAQTADAIFREQGPHMHGASNVFDLRARLRLVRQLEDVAAGRTSSIDILPLLAIRGTPDYPLPTDLSSLDRLIGALLPLLATERESTRSVISTCFERATTAAVAALFWPESHSTPGCQSVPDVNAQQQGLPGRDPPEDLPGCRRLPSIAGHMLLRTLWNDPSQRSLLREAIDAPVVPRGGPVRRLVLRLMRRSRRQDLRAATILPGPEDSLTSAYIMSIWSMVDPPLEVTIPAEVDRPILMSRMVDLATREPQLACGLAAKLLELCPPEPK